MLEFVTAARSGATLRPLASNKPRISPMKRPRSNPKPDIGHDLQVGPELTWFCLAASRALNNDQTARQYLLAKFIQSLLKLFAGIPFTSNASICPTPPAARTSTLVSWQSDPRTCATAVMVSDIDALMRALSLVLQRRSATISKSEVAPSEV